MNLLLIRHAQSTNNLLYAQTGKTVGRSSDPLLSELGHEQARALAEFARGDATFQKLTHLYCSLTTRAVQTASPLAHVLGLKVQGLQHAHETQGLFHRDEEGLKHPVVGRTHADLLTENPALLWPADLPDGEGWPGGFEPQDVTVYRARAQRVIADLRASHGPDDWVGLVTHGHFTQFLLAEMLGHSAAYFTVFNTATTLFTLLAQPEQAPDEEWAGLTWLVGWVNRFDHLTKTQVTE